MSEDPVVPGLIRQVWRLEAERDQARRIAVELEQRNSEALRLLGGIRGPHNCAALHRQTVRVLRGEDDDR